MIVPEVERSSPRVVSPVTVNVPTVRLPDPVALVKVRLEEDAVPKTAVLVTCRATPDPWRPRVVPVLFVNVMLEEETVPKFPVLVTCSAPVVRLVEETLVEETVAKLPVLVMARDPTARLPDPVALVKVRLLEDTVPPCMVRTPLPDALVKVSPVVEATPAKIAVPVAVTLNCVVEFCWNTRKSPLKDDDVLIPMKVPEALGRACVELPRLKSADDVDWGGAPGILRARAAFCRSVRVLNITSDVEAIP